MDKFLNARVEIKRDCWTFRQAPPRKVYLFKLVRDFDDSGKNFLELVYYTLDPLDTLKIYENDKIILLNMQKCHMKTLKIGRVAEAVLGDECKLYDVEKDGCWEHTFYPYFAGDQNGGKTVASIFRAYVIVNKNNGKMIGSIMLLDEEKYFLREVFSDLRDGHNSKRD